MWDTELGVRWGQSVVTCLCSPHPGERDAHLNHLVGVGVVEHELGEGSTAGWNENHHTIRSVTMCPRYCSYINTRTPRGIWLAESLRNTKLSFWRGSGTRKMSLLFM